LTGPWTVRRGDSWGLLDPERGRVLPVTPSDDDRLPGITDALAAGQLIGYRHGRRAVVKTPTSFIKVVRPSRVSQLVERHHAVADATTGLETPAVLAATPDGRVELTRVAGSSLHQQLRMWPSRPLHDIGRAMAAFHEQPITAGVGPPHHDDPANWVEISKRSPTRHLPAIERAGRALPELERRDNTVVHGDLHDKNIFSTAHIPAAGSALIDLDGLRLGAPEDDMANLAVHLELRNLQANTGLPAGARSRLLYIEYERFCRLDHDRLRVVERHTWFRLACLYQYRAASASLVPGLLRASSG